MWGEAGRKTEAQCHKLGWLQWEAPGTRQVLDSLDSHRMKLSLEHFPQHAGLEVQCNTFLYVMCVHMCGTRLVTLHLLTYMYI